MAAERKAFPNLGIDRVGERRLPDSATSPCLRISVGTQLRVCELGRSQTSPSRRERAPARHLPDAFLAVASYPSPRYPASCDDNNALRRFAPLRQYAGRLTKDPVLHKISEEMSVCELRLAVDGMGRGREVGFINVSVFGKAGEAAAEYLGKGWLVAVDGRLEFGQWETGAGEKRDDYTVVGNVELLTAPRPAEEHPAKPALAKKQPVAA